MKPLNDRAYSHALHIGFWFTGAGFFLGAFTLLAGVTQGKHPSAIWFEAIGGFFIGLFFIGLFTIMYTLARGLGKVNNTPKQVRRCDYAHVVARYAITALGETIFDASYVDVDDPKTQLLVRLNVPGYGSHEYRCNPIIWGQCGEGLTGTAMIQGDWIGQFIRYIGDGEGHPYAHQEMAPYRAGNL